MPLFDCWLKYGGNYWSFFKLSRLEDLEPADRLVAAILSHSVTSADQLSRGSLETVSKALELLIESELCGYACEAIYFLNLETLAKEISVNYSDASSNVLAVLSRQSSVEAIKFEKFDAKFTEFLEATAEIQNELIWLKGIVTSRTFYPSPQLRLSSDFDCFIEPSALVLVDTVLQNLNFSVITGDTGFCNQLGVGPVSSFNELFLAPSEELVASGVVGYHKVGWPIIDLKISPFDRGLKMVEGKRFKTNAIEVHWQTQSFYAPDLLDQLIISLTHLEKDRFKGWKQLLDIKILAENVNKNSDQWNEFVRRCRVEGVSTACWAGLTLAKDRLELSCVDDVVAQLEPSRLALMARFFIFTVTPLFYWNTSSFPMLLANAIFSDDASRKLEVLKTSLLPHRQFLSNYYCEGAKLSLISYPVVLLLHWLVLFLPGGLVRRTFGVHLWRGAQFGIQRSEKPN